MVNVCTGLPEPGTLASWDEFMGATDSAEWMAERVAEDRRALAHAGIEPVNLPFLDDQYRDGELLDLDELRASLSPFIGRAECVYAPVGLGRHADHVAVRDVVLAETAERGLPVLLYADQPYATRFGWPSWVSGVEPEGERSEDERSPDEEWVSDLAAIAVPLEPEVVDLGAEELAAKVRALREYRTQLSGLEGMAPVTSAEISGREVRWKVTGPHR